MEKDRIVTVVNKIQLMGTNIYNKLDKEIYDEDSVRGMVGDLAALMSSVNKIVPHNIYDTYQEFFDSFIQLSNKCKDREQFKNDISIYKDSLELVIECFENIVKAIETHFVFCICCEAEGVFETGENGELICPNCGSTLFDRNLIAFLQTGNIELAEEGFELVNLSHRKCVRDWMNYYCPQVKYIEGNLSSESDKYGDVIVTDTELELDGYYTHLINFDNATPIYVLSKANEEKFDFAWKWKPNEELCNNGPLVSVVLPCYNHEEFVEEAILSVINQSYKNIEFIVADDGSSDNSQQIMKKYEKYYAKSLYFDENAGGRMYELKEYVTGKYVAIMHSDDFWHKDKIAMQVEYMEKNPDCGACLTWCRNVDRYANLLPDHIFIQPNRSREEWMRFFWENGNALCNPSTLTKSDMFYNKLWQGTAGRQLPDFFKWVDMVQHHPIHIITKELTFMRRYQMENLENTSIDSSANSINMHIEMGINWPFCLRDMEDEFFVKAFKQYFVNEDASAEEELLCEKYFLLLNHTSPFVQHGGMHFFNEFFIKIRDCLMDKYNYDIKKYRADARSKGMMGFLKGIVY